MGKSDKNLPLVLVSSIFLILFLSQFFSDELRIKVLDIFRLPLKVISSSYYALRDISNFRELKTENTVLKENVKNLEKEVSDLKEAQEENKRLRLLLGFTQTSSAKFVPCMVIARDSSDFRDAIIIDKGKRHNIQEDMVVVSGNVLVGRVVECGRGISRVLLITDRDSVVSAIVQRTRDEGAIYGNMRSGLVMKYLDLACGVKGSDKVITSGFGSIFEKGILIGEVVAVEKDPSGLYLNAVVKPAVDLRKMEEVLAIR